jgi:hypothetical protein
MRGCVLYVVGLVVGLTLSYLVLVLLLELIDRQL